MSLRWGWMAAAVVFVATSFGASANAQEQPTQVRVDPVRTEPLSQTVPILGRLVADQRGEVAARVGGAVQRLAVQVGDRVEVGDIIAVIDKARLTARAELAAARVVAAEAQIEADRAQVSLLEQERARLERLQNSAAFSAAAFEDKAQEIIVATAGIGRAEAQLDEALADQVLAARDVTDAEVIAPYPGVVTNRYVSAGDYVQTGEPVVSLVNDTSLEIEADVPSAQARALTSGTKLTVDFEGATVGTATLRAVIPDENPLTRTLAVRLALDGTEREVFLASGQSVTIMVPVGAMTDVVTVDKDAVLRRGSGAMVFVAADGAATPRPVMLGEAVGQRFQVLDGLAEGELVVVRGNERLRPGQSISFEPPQSAAQPVADSNAS